MKQMREPSGRSAIASTFRIGRFSLSAIAIGQSSWASGVPSGRNSFQVTHHISPIFGVRPANSIQARLKKVIRPSASVV